MGIDNDNKTVSIAAELRQRAEEQLHSRVSDVTASQGEITVQRLLHELQVHQIELEMQNENLRSVNAELIEREQQLMKSQSILEANNTLQNLFIQHAPAALAMFDLNMHYLQVSQRWLDDYGITNRNLCGLSHYEVFPEISDQWREAHRRGMAGEVLRAEADRFERLDGSVQWVTWEIRPWYDSSREIGGIVIFSENITEHKLAEEALLANEIFISEVLNSMISAVAVLDNSGTITMVNESWRAFAVENYGTASIPWHVGTNYLDIYRTSGSEGEDESARASLAGICAVLQGEQANFVMEYPCHSPSHGRCFKMTVSPLKGTKRGVVIVHSDISERIRSERQLIDLNQRLSDMNKHLLNVQEEERLTLSRDIHDDLGQTLTIMKLDLEDIELRLAAYGSERCHSVINMRVGIEDVIARIKQIASELRPPLLDNLGLAAAIGWQVNEVRKRCAIEFFVMLNDEVDFLDHTITTVVMRIFQEALTNIVRHSRATEVSVSLCKKENYLQLELSDNGCGITTEQLDSSKAFGIMGMRERAKSCQGLLEIAGSPDNGTIISLLIPWHRGETTL